MDKRRAWREQEARLVERWTAAEERYRSLHAEFQRAGAQGGHAEQLAAVQQEREAVRREVARLKVEFNSGRRY